MHHTELESSSIHQALGRPIPAVDAHRRGLLPLNAELVYHRATSSVFESFVSCRDMTFVAFVFVVLQCTASKLVVVPVRAKKRVSA